MTVVTNMYKTSYIFITCQVMIMKVCVSLMHTPSSKELTTVMTLFFLLFWMKKMLLLT